MLTPVIKHMTKSTLRGRENKKKNQSEDDCG